MQETRKILDTLKRCLRARSMTYGQLGRIVGLSESAMKRLFSDGSFSVARLERICGALGMTIADLARMTAGARETQQQPQMSSLTMEQERTLASTPSLLACFYLLLNGRTVEQTEQRLGLSARTMNTLLGRLSAARLLDVGPRRDVQLHATLPIAWRADGPVRRLYERQVRAEFLQGSFASNDEALTFHSAELSPTSVRLLLRKIDKLAADFADLAALDVQLPPRSKTSVALLLACRPWVFSMFSAYRTKKS